MNPGSLPMHQLLPSKPLRPLLGSSQHSFPSAVSDSIQYPLRSFNCLIFPYLYMGCRAMFYLKRKTKSIAVFVKKENRKNLHRPNSLHSYNNFKVETNKLWSDKSVSIIFTCWISIFFEVMILSTDITFIAGSSPLYVSYQAPSFPLDRR